MSNFSTSVYVVYHTIDDTLMTEKLEKALFEYTSYLGEKLLKVENI